MSLASLAIARDAFATARTRIKLAHYTGILALQAQERLAHLHRIPEDIAALRCELLPFLNGERTFTCNFPNYTIGGNASAAALFHGLLPEARAAVATQAELFLSAPRDRAGLVCMPKVPEQEKVWIDAAWAVTPFALHAGLALNRSDLVDEACHQALGMVSLFRNPDNGLLHQSRGFTGPGRFSTDHWSRGNAWGLLALAVLAEDLPAAHPRRSEARAAFADLVAACLRVQGPTGMWHQELPRHDSFVETSGSGSVLYSLGLAISLGLAPDGARAALERGLRAYLGYIALDGSVHHTCVGCLSPGDGSPEAYMAHRHAKDDPHAFGPVTLAFAQAAAVGINTIGVRA
jgi:unsaturated rhamnogalacturonyl hydrolase